MSDAHSAEVPSGDVAPGEVVLSMRGLRKRFGSKEVLRGLDLDVRRGEILTLLGASGSGKSVLLKVIVGLVRADAGEVIFHGGHLEGLDDHALAPVRRRIGMVFQSAALFDSLSVADNVAYGLRAEGPGGLAPDAIRTRVAWALECVGLRDADVLMPSELSGGMRKRIGVARTIALRPEVVLYDEPTTGLDPRNSARIGALIASLREQLAVTSVIVTHDLALARSVSDRLAFLHEGRIVAVGSVADVSATTDPIVRAFLDGTAGGAD